MPTSIEHQPRPRNRVFDAVSTLRFAAALGLCIALVAAIYQPQRAAPDRTTAALWDASHYLLNAFLIPALEQDTLPLRWIDPRPGLNCGPDTTVQVNGEPLRAGTMVPVMSFDLTWQVHDCRPFGLDGPRFDGAVTLTVTREDWGFSAMVLPTGLHYTRPDGDVVDVMPGSQTLPRKPVFDETID